MAEQQPVPRTCAMGKRFQLAELLNWMQQACQRGTTPFAPDHGVPVSVG